MRAFRSPEVCRLAGITYRQLDYWGRSGVLKPSVLSARGHGSHRLYSEGDVVKLAVISRLTEAGVNLRAACHASQVLRYEEGAPEGVLVLADGLARLCRTPEELMEAASSGRVLSVLSLGQMLRDLNDQIEAAPQRPQLVS